MCSRVFILTHKLQADVLEPLQRSLASPLLVQSFPFKISQGKMSREIKANGC